MNALLMASDGLQPMVDAPVWVVLVFKATAILSVAWLVHLAIARTNPRWRVFLWRVTALGLLTAPLIAWLAPAVEIRLKQSPTIKAATAVAATPHALPHAPRGDWAVRGDVPLDLRVHPSGPEAGRLSRNTAAEPFADSSAAPPAQTLAPAPAEPPLVTTPVLLPAGFSTSRAGRLPAPRCRSGPRAGSPPRVTAAQATTPGWRWKTAAWRWNSPPPRRMPMAAGKSTMSPIVHGLN